jgi:predicted AAA+ superfamily ATPase
VVLASSAATGKTSLLQFLEKRLKEEEGASVIRIDMDRAGTVESLFEQLAKKGIYTEVKKLRSFENTWLLLDDAQNAYDRKFDPFWQFVVKSIGSAGVEENVFVVLRQPTSCPPTTSTV